ncbi:hypothetical protein QJS83_04390 [Bdellovibrio sp. 22V]|uniref:hypothetical protein n=1 Tax=Bdellovibrio sp. 22V TaxID=3044166 RepID=UPI0025432C38|nr:hypothetical protein [Bdellovibrio sp. 22V]WII73110.1 hypothetical protein QJS83_04390 [Bdellovibrio sp. 22V]
MKRVFGRITAAILISGLVGACAPQSDSGQEAGTVRILAPTANTKGSYSLGFLDLKGLKDLQTMAGEFARFFIAPKIVNKRLHGEAPHTRFIRNSDGNYIPANELTQQMVTVYAHMQKLAELDTELGAEGVNTWPRDIGVAVRVKGRNGANNAYYDGETDSMLFVPYNQQNLPIAINAGILAHEHFHSLFFKLVMKDLPFKGNAHNRKDFFEEVQEDDFMIRERRILPIIKGAKEIDPTIMHFYYHVALSRGLNEGLADFWGWMYTGDPDFIAQSLPSEKSLRSLHVDGDVNELPTSESIQAALRIYFSAGDKEKFRDYSIGYSYSLGTQFSRVLKRFTDIYAKARGVEALAARKEVAKIIVQILPEVKKSLQNLEKSFYSSELFLQTLAAKMPDLKQAECEYLKEVINNSVDNIGTSYSCIDGNGQIILGKAVNAEGPTNPEAKDEGLAK